MKKALLNVFDKIYDKTFVPMLIGGLVLIGCTLYKQGRADAIHKIYEHGYSIVDENDDMPDSK